MIRESKIIYQLPKVTFDFIYNIQKLKMYRINIAIFIKYQINIDNGYFIIEQFLIQYNI